MNRKRVKPEGEDEAPNPSKHCVLKGLCSLCEHSFFLTRREKNYLFEEADHLGDLWKADKSEKVAHVDLTTCYCSEPRLVEAQGREGGFHEVHNTVLKCDGFRSRE